MRRTYVESEIDTALQMLSDLQSWIYDPGHERSDRSAMINDVATMLDEHRRVLTSSNMRIVGVTRESKGYLVRIGRGSGCIDVHCSFDSYGQLKVLSRDESIRKFLVDNREGLPLWRS